MQFKLLCGLLIAGTLFSCSDDDETKPGLEIPESYEFTRDGKSTVSYQGQTDRLNMLAEMKSYIAKGNAGEQISSAVLLDMYSNENDPFTDPVLNESTKQLEDKTFASDVQWMKELFNAAAEASQTDAAATEGAVGRIERGNSGNFILVNGKGWEFTQMLEKVLMGAVFYNQIYNSYLSEAKTGDDVDNETLVEGKNYTTMEHHWDEAFGYWGVPADFPNGSPVLPAENERFWAKYTNSVDDLLGTNKMLMDAYLKGRAAIVAKLYDVKNEQKQIIYEGHELVAAANAVHYINAAMGDLSSGDIGNLFHHLSEGYGFVNALQYSPVKRITAEEIFEILNTNFGTYGNFWDITKEGGLDLLKGAKEKLVVAYPELETIKDQL